MVNTGTRGKVMLVSPQSKGGARRLIGQLSKVGKHSCGWKNSGPACSAVFPIPFPRKRAGCKRKRKSPTQGHRKASPHRNSSTASACPTSPSPPSPPRTNPGKTGVVSPCRLDPYLLHGCRRRQSFCERVTRRSALLHCCWRAAPAYFLFSGTTGEFAFLQFAKLFTVSLFHCRHLPISLFSLLLPPPLPKHSCLP